MVVVSLLLSMGGGPGYKHTLWHREQQPIVQTISQRVSHEWKTPATLPRPCHYIPKAIDSILFIDEHHIEVSKQRQEHS